MEIKKVKLTKSEAKTLLGGNIHNRPMTQAKVEMYRADMNAGRWNVDTGEPIKVTSDMRLLDGQNRLEAFVGSNRKTLAFWIAYGVPEAAQEFMDLGRPRSIHDVLRLRYPDLKVLPVVAALSRWLTIVDFSGDKEFLSSIKRAASVHEMLRTFEADPKGIEFAAYEAHKFASAVPFFPPTVVAWCWYHMEAVDPGAGAEFFGAMRHLSFSEGKDPRRAVYEKAQRMYQDPNISNGQKEVSAMLATLITRGYNYWATGEQRQVVPITSTSGGRLLGPAKPVKREVKA